MNTTAGAATPHHTTTATGTLLDTIRSIVERSTSETISHAAVAALLPGQSQSSIRHSLAKLVKEGYLFAIDSDVGADTSAGAALRKTPGKSPMEAAQAKQMYHNLMHPKVIGQAVVTLVAAARVRLPVITLSSMGGRKYASRATQAVECCDIRI